MSSTWVAPNPAPTSSSRRAAPSPVSGFGSSSGACAGTVASAAASTSFTVINPAVSSVARSTPSSCARSLAFADARTSPVSLFALSASSFRAVSKASSAASSSKRCATGSPMVTSPPTGTSWRTRPSAGASISNADLVVSTSTSGIPALTSERSGTCHSTTVAVSSFTSVQGIVTAVKPPPPGWPT